MREFTEDRCQHRSEVSGSSSGVSRALLACLPIALLVVMLTSVTVGAWRGLDLTDEGMYILSVAAQDPQAAFHNPFGSGLKWMYLLSGRDLPIYRLAASLLLTMGALLVAASVYSIFACIWQRRSWLAFVALATASLMIPLGYYALGLFTPSYNWLNLFAICLGTSGALVISRWMLIARRDGGAQVNAVVPVVTGVLLVGLAIYFGSLAKVSTGPLLLILLTFSLVWCGSSLRDLLRVLILVAGISVLFFGVHFLVLDTPAVLLEKVDRGRQALLILDPNYSLSAALYSALRGVAALAFHTLRYAWPLLALSVLIIFLRRYRRTAHLTDDRRFRGAVALAFVVSGFALTFVGRIWTGSASTYAHQAWAALVVLLAVLLALAFSFPLNDATRFDPLVRPRYQGWVPACVLVAGSAIYAFGSGNGFNNQISGAAGFLILAACYVSVVMGVKSALVAMTVLTSLSGLQLAIATHEAPYRRLPSAEQTTPLSLPRGEGTLLVDQRTAQQVTEMRAALEQSGWREGTRMLDLTEYSASLVYLLGASPPLTIIPTVGGYESTNNLLEWSLEQHVRRFGIDDLRHAWVLTQSQANDDDTSVNPGLARRWGVDLNADYEVIFDDGMVTIWRPR